MDLSTREGRKQQGERIKRAARDADTSLEDLATKIGCSRALIYQYASGASLAQTDRLQAIAAVLDKPLTWFFTTGVEAQANVPAVSNAEQQTTAENDQRRIRERIAHLQALAAAYAAPTNWRGVIDTAQQLIPLLEHEEQQQEVAEVLLTQGNALLQLNELGAAREKLQEAGRLFRALHQPDYALACQQSLGQANIMLGRTDEALRQFQQVAAGSNWPQRWQGTLSVGAAEEVLGNYRSAAEHFVRALEIVEECDDPTQTDIARLYIEANWANLELDWGDYEDAAERAEQCILRAQQHGIQDQYVEALLTRGIALLGVNQFRLALSEIQRALNLSEVTRDLERWSLALSCRALVLAACGRAADAVIDGKQALAIALRCSATRAEMLAQRALAEAYLGASNLDEAEYHIEQADSIAAGMRLRLPQAQFAALRGRLALRKGNPDVAESAAAAALKIAEELGSKPVQWDGSLLMAQIAQERGLRQEAIRHGEAALAIGREMRASAVAWRVLSVIAQSWMEDDNAVEAEGAFRAALQLLRDDRRVRSDAAAKNALLENPEAAALWRQWLILLMKTGRVQEAESQAVTADWPPLLQWLEDYRREQDGPRADA